MEKTLKEIIEMENNKFRMSCISTDEKHLGDIKADYALYAYLITISNQNPDNRAERPYVYKNQLGTDKELLEKINGFVPKDEMISLPTLKRRKAALIKCGILEQKKIKDNKTVYLLPALTKWAYIETDLLERLPKRLTSNAIKLYCLYRAYCNDEKTGYKCKASQAYLAKSIGLSEKSLKLIIDYNRELLELGLITIEKIAYNDENGYKTNNIIRTVPYENTNMNVARKYVKAERKIEKGLIDMQNIVEDDKEATIFTVNPYLQGGIKMSMMDFFGCE